MSRLWLFLSSDFFLSVLLTSSELPLASWLHLWLMSYLVTDFSWVALILSIILPFPLIMDLMALCRLFKVWDIFANFLLIIRSSIITIRYWPQDCCQLEIIIIFVCDYFQLSIDTEVFNNPRNSVMPVRLLPAPHTTVSVLLLCWKWTDCGWYGLCIPIKTYQYEGLTDKIGV